MSFQERSAGATVSGEVWFDLKSGLGGPCRAR
jgi:hypothetical protein